MRLFYLYFSGTRMSSRVSSVRRLSLVDLCYICWKLLRHSCPERKRDSAGAVGSDIYIYIYIRTRALAAGKSMGFMIVCRGVAPASDLGQTRAVAETVAFVRTPLARRARRVSHISLFSGALYIHAHLTIPTRDVFGECDEASIYYHIYSISIHMHMCVRRPNKP